MMGPKTTTFVLVMLLVVVCFTATVIAMADSSKVSRVAYLDIDILWDDSRDQMLVNMDNAVAYLERLNVNTVFIQAYRDNEGYTRVHKMYYPNAALGDYTSADNKNSNAFVALANKVKAKGMLVGAWMPILAFQFDSINNKPAEYVMTYVDGQVIRTPCDASAYYCRLTPFHQDNFVVVRSLYRDLLAAYPDLDIINGHDDGAMNQQEDCSPSALAAYATNGFSNDCKTVTEYTGAQGLQWAKFKSQTISYFFRDLINDLKSTKPTLKSSRNVYVNSVLDSDSVKWFSQDPTTILSTLDYIAPMVFPMMENIESTSDLKTRYNSYFTDFITKYREFDDTLDKLQLCLQSFDWRGDGIPVSSDEFDEWVRHALYDLGVKNVGWYPTNHYSDALYPAATTNLATYMDYIKPTSPDGGDGGDGDGGDGTDGGNFAASVQVFAALAATCIAAVLLA